VEWIAVGTLDCAELRTLETSLGSDPAILFCSDDREKAVALAVDT
jgi:hypothetical protein